MQIFSSKGFDSSAGGVPSALVDERCVFGAEVHRKSTGVGSRKVPGEGRGLLVAPKQLPAELVLGRSALRDRLQPLTDTRDLFRHPILLDELSRALPNSIKCLSVSILLRFGPGAL